MPNQLKFASWNLNVWKRGAAACKEKAQFLLDAEWDVAALQEVTEPMVEALRELRVAESFAFPGEVSGGYASALIARNGFTLAQPSLVACLPRPCRGVWAHVELGGRVVDVCSWHAPNAAKSTDRVNKQASYIGFNAWIRARSHPLVVGTDANHGALWTRISDFPDAEFSRDYPHDSHWEENRFWTDPEHDLRDLWLVYLRDHTAELQRVRDEWARAAPQPVTHVRGNGRASAVTHIRGKGARAVHDRFDYVLSSPEFSVRDFSHDYDGAIRAGSDHALVRASLALE